MNNRFRATTMVACLLVICGCEKRLPVDAAPKDVSEPATTAEAPQVKWTLELTGVGLGKPTTFTYEQLVSMEMVKLENVLMKMTHEPDKRVSFAGPSLASLLATAEIKPGPMTVKFEAEDGYAVKCSTEDLKSAILALKDGQGHWLARVGKKCPIRLVPPEKPGNYWVMYLNRVTVEPVAGSASSG